MGILIGRMPCPLCAAVGVTTSAELCESVGGRRKHVYWRCEVCGTCSPMLPRGQANIRACQTEEIAPEDRRAVGTPKAPPKAPPEPAPTQRVPVLGGLFYRDVPAPDETKEEK